MNQELRIKNKKIKIGFLIVLASCFLTLASTAKAYAENIALGIYPPIIQIEAKAPADIQSPLTITNEGSAPIEVHIGVRPFTQNSNDNGEPFYFTQGQRVGDDPDIYQKMSIFDGTKNTDTITLAPSQKKNIELRIHLPTGEPPSDYYFSIVFVSKPIATDHESGAAVAGGISTNVLLSIGPKGPTTGYIKEFSSPLFLDHGPVPFTVHVANTSKHFIAPQGQILVKNMFGQIIGKINLRQDIILAGTSRYLTDGVIQDTRHNHPTTFWNEKILLGFYSAHLSLALSGEGPLYGRTIYFFALPIQVLIGVILGIILVAVVIYRVKKKLNHSSS